MTQPNDDLLWKAYRYSAGELSADEAILFEEQLAADQMAREALASAVALSETVCAIEREAAPTRPALMPATTRRSWLQPAGWVVVAAAACLALTFVWQGGAIRQGGAIWQGWALRQGPAPNENGVPQAGRETAVKVEPADVEAELLLALLESGTKVDGRGEAESTLVPSLNSELLHDEFLQHEFHDDVVDLALDAVQQSADGDDSDLEDQNSAPDWIMAAVVESKS